MIVIRSPVAVAHKEGGAVRVAWSFSQDRQKSSLISTPIIPLPHLPQDYLIMLEKASNFDIYGGTFNEVYQTGNRSGFDRLYKKTLSSASYDSWMVTEYKASCMEGTRTQYVEDITSWATSVSQTHPQRLLWLYGPAGVGKSAVAKSCATETARIDRLAASFFFSRDNGVVDPARFFTTLAHQIATQVPEYKTAVVAKIEADQTLLDKGLETQFMELIIRPFLGLQNLPKSLPQRAVFIDGLDECDSELAQAKIIDLVSTSVAKYGESIPLLWAFFSRPERHIHNAFLPHLQPLPIWTIHLEVSRDHDDDIRLYFRNYLQRRTSVDDIFPPVMPPAWPSEEDLETLVAMVAGLFIYAATIVKFIMDETAVSPRRQLRDVLEFHSWLQERSAQQPVTRTVRVTSKLDAFYSLIMERIPRQHLLVIQRVLLIAQAIREYHSDIPIRIPAIILDLTLSDLKNSLSKLRSVLELRQGRPAWRWEERRWPGSETIHFYHASFMEFLWDRERSREYCIQDTCHYSFLAARGMYLVKEMYQMNGLSRDDRLDKLQKLFTVFPSELRTPETCLNFRDELLYDYLCYHTMLWCAHSGNSIEASEAIRATAEVVNLSYFFPMEEDKLELLSEENRQLIESHLLLRHTWPPSPSPKVDVQNTESSNVPPRWNVLGASIISILDGSETFSEAAKITEKLSPLIHEAWLSKYIRSKLTRSFSSSAQIALARAKEVDLDALTDIELLDYYSFEWFKDDSRELALNYLAVAKAPQIFSYAIESPWVDFFFFVQGDSHRLTRAICNLLTHRRNGDLIPLRAPSINSPLNYVLYAFMGTVGYISGSFTYTMLTQIQTELQQATEAYYRAESPLILTGSPTSYFYRVASLIQTEMYIFCHGITSSLLTPVSSGVCIEVLMEDHWTELLNKVGKVLASGNDPDDCLEIMRDIIGYSRQRVPRFQHILREHISNATRNVITQWGLDGMPSEKIRACASALLDVKERQYEEALEVLHLYNNHPSYHHAADEAFYEVLDRHPVWRHAVDEVLAEQEGEVFRALFFTASDSDLRVDPHDLPPPTQSGKQSPLDSSLHSSQGAPSNAVKDQILSSSERDTKGDLEEIVGESDNTPSDGQAYRATEPGVSNQKTRDPEKVRKRDILVKSMRRIFKRS
ncbi:hypothetical protein NP233_g2652 [Leucocoprinus birnbaumii]|uniref:NACHT domain-containing protein n=1 Tax=Leucocoprinus birnbaumii TaxID=56174 RepID=A0AAD5W0A9_9AGAR|nr:hypothetical protein NP233_g2652 [Leucocoprinus birnbaumii]